MNIKDILSQFKSGIITEEDAVETIRKSLSLDIGHSRLDLDREERTGYPEVIFSQRKTPEQLNEIITVLRNKGQNILATRITAEQKEFLKQTRNNDLEYNKLAQTLTLKQKEVVKGKGIVVVVTAGTSDLPVAEEAAVTAEFFGSKVDRISDVGVAGIHRLLTVYDRIKKARVLIVVAGMEGALPSVIGGLVDKPVIAVPTSVGYGASFGGLAALLGMLNSCASGVSVVNIDNGFGAGYTASLINRL